MNQSDRVTIIILLWSCCRCVSDLKAMTQSRVLHDLFLCWVETNGDYEVKRDCFFVYDKFWPSSVLFRAIWL